ncbi:MAG: rebM 3 [Acidobacteria bacterium]|nr:rebM 3 [Acidobacteriota bacterium]
MSGTPATRWSQKASALYDPAYARKYRAYDDDVQHGGPYRAFAEWLAAVCALFTPPIDVLDLGCGTGRYFWALTGVRNLVGIDASPAMLAEAARPLHADRITAEDVTLVQGDLLAHDFQAGQFDLIYSIGVLAEHAPLDAIVAAHVHRWLRAGGRFVFTTVHPDSASIAQTLPRRLGRALGKVLPAPIARPIRDRLLAGGLYADEQRITELLADTFEIEALRQFDSEAHRHCWCVARKRNA